MFYKMQACTVFIVQMAVCCWVSAHVPVDGSDFSEKALLKLRNDRLLRYPETQ